MPVLRTFYGNMQDVMAGLELSILVTMQAKRLSIGLTDLSDRRIKHIEMAVTSSGCLS